MRPAEHREIYTAERIRTALTHIPTLILIGTINSICNLFTQRSLFEI